MDFSSVFRKVKDTINRKLHSSRHDQNQHIQVLHPPQNRQSSGASSNQHIQIIRRNDSPGSISTRPINGSAIKPERRDIGKGIHVTAQSRPKVCPDCRSPDSIIEQRNGNKKWKCIVCGKQF